MTVTALHARVDACKTWLEEALREDDLTVAELRELAQFGGWSWATVRRAAEKADVLKYRAGLFGRGEWVWTIRWTRVPTHRRRWSR